MTMFRTLSVLLGPILLVWSQTTTSNTLDCVVTFPSWPLVRYIRNCAFLSKVDQNLLDVRTPSPYTLDFEDSMNSYCADVTWYGPATVNDTLFALATPSVESYRGLRLRPGLPHLSQLDRYGFDSWRIDHCPMVGWRR